MLCFQSRRKPQNISCFRNDQKQEYREKYFFLPNTVDQNASKPRTEGLNKTAIPHLEKLPRTALLQTPMSPSRCRSGLANHSALLKLKNC